MAALVTRSRRLAAAAGQRVGDSVVGELDQTLTAALADPRVADEVLSGQLTGPREHVGFGSATAGGQHLTVVPDGDSAPLPRGRPASPPRLRTPPAGRGKLTLTQPDQSAKRAQAETTRREREAEQARTAARAAAGKELDRARSALLAAQERQRASDAVAAEAAQTVDEWRELTASARGEVAQTERELRKLTAALDRARAKLGEAEHKETRAKDELASARLATRTAGAAVRAARDEVAKAQRAAERTAPTR